MTDPEKQAIPTRTAAEVPAEAYEPPRLIPLGNLRNLVGKSGPEIDGSPFEPERPPH